MRIPGKKFVRSSARWIRSRFVDSALILGYHGIAEVSRDPYSLCVTPENFYEQMLILKKHAYPLPLGELINAVKSVNFPTRAVALTFDDGYSDILYNAKPILDKLNIPCIVFVVSGNLGKEFWWDELGRMILEASDTIGELTLKFNAQEYRWVLSKNADYTQRHNVLLSIYSVLRNLPESLRQIQLEQIRIWARGNYDRAKSRRCLTSNELGTLIRGGLADIGAHGSSHTDLAVLPPDQYESEIKKSKEYLEEIIGRSVQFFSYPNGSFNSGIKEEVKEANYHGACASYNDVVWRGSDPYSLPRYWIPNINGQQFHYWLRRWT